MATDTKPPRFFFDRRHLGSMEVMQDVLDGITIGGASASGIAAYFSSGWGAVIGMIFTILFQLLKRGIASVLSRSLPINPINTTDTTTVSTPDVVTPPVTQ